MAPHRPPGPRRSPREPVPSRSRAALIPVPTAPPATRRQRSPRQINGKPRKKDTAGTIPVLSIPPTRWETHGGRWPGLTRLPPWCHRCYAIETAERGSHARRFHEGIAGGRRSFRPPDPPLEPEDEAFHLHRARWHLHHRPPADAGAGGRGVQ